MDIQKINAFVGLKIKERRKSLGINQDELAKKIGVGKTTISNYEVGIRSPKKPQLLKLAEVFGISVDDFFPSIETKQSTTKQILDNVFSKLETKRQEKVVSYAKSELEDQNKVVNIKYYTYEYYDNAVSAGTGQYIGQTKKEEIKLPVDIDCDYVLCLSGDSMEPEYHTGDYIFVESTINLKDGEIGIFEYCGDDYIKKLIIEDEHAYLRSFNDKYDDIYIDEKSDFRVLGRVVGRYAE